MAFWATPLTRDSGDPKRKFRFTVQFDGLDFGEGIIWFAKSVGKPEITVTEAEHTFLDKKYYYPGRVEWNTVTFTLVDPADVSKDQDAVRQMNTLIEAAGYKIPKSPNGPGSLETMSKGKSSASLSTIVINQINGEGVTIESWTLNNPFIKSAKFGELDYTGDELVELSLEVRYDWATCSILDSAGNLVEFYSLQEQD